MKKFKILLSLITITILLTSCNEATSITDLYGDDYGDNWLTEYFKTE
jgi:PBP1b-binding outer membrane lipoprotein LpoB